MRNLRNNLVLTRNNHDNAGHPGKYFKQPDTFMNSLLRTGIFFMFILPLVFPFLLAGESIVTTENANSQDILACAGCAHGAEMHQLMLAELSEPVIMRRTPPYYPEEFHSVTGTVVLEVTVLPDSSIGYVEIKESIPLLDSLAIKTIETWDFIPSFKDGEPVISFVTVDVNFDSDISGDYEVTAAFEEVKSLRREIARYLSNKREIKKHTLLKVPLPIQSENYHLYSPFRQSPIITRNGFTLIPGYTTAAHKLQTYFPFYEYSIRPHKWEFNSETYELPVALVDAYLGLGYLDMDYGHLSIFKNNLFEAENLQFVASFITEDGYWMGDDGITDNMVTDKARESRSELMADLFYSFGDFAFRWSSLLLSQSSPSAKYRYVDAPPILRIDKIQKEHSFYIANPFIDIGFRYEKIEYESIDDPVGVSTKDNNPERKLLQLNLNRRISFYDHSFLLQWEAYQITDNYFSSLPYASSEQENLFTVGYDFDTTLMYLNAEVMSGLGYEYLAASEAGYKLGNSLHWGIGYMENSRDDMYNLLQNQDEEQFFPSNQYLHQNSDRDIYTVIRLKHPRYQTMLPGLNLRIGMQDIRQQSYTHNADGISEREIDTIYLSGDYIVNHNQGRTKWSLYGYGLYHHDNVGMLYLPKVFARNTLECNFILEHNNIITFGFVHHYASDFETEINPVGETQTLDAFLRLSITDKFDIQADVMNITETDQLYGISNRAGLHFNAGIRWLFFN